MGQVPNLLLEVAPNGELDLGDLGLAEVAEKFAKAGVNILSTLTVGRRAGVVEMAFAVDDAEKAKAALTPCELAGVG